MKTPSLSEVKKHFENAETIKCISSGNTANITKDIRQDIHLWNDQYWIDLNNYSGGNAMLWNKKGYAEILTYKTPVYSITKEQIIKYNMREEFPEAFETVLEVGKWYIRKDRSNKSICFVKNPDDYSNLGFGINNNGIWTDNFNGSGLSKHGLGVLTEATESEVFEALKNEAVKRGYKKGIYTEDLFFEPKKDFAVISSNEFDWENAFCGKQSGKKCLRDSDGNVIFVDGVWAEIIPTITKQEAELLIGKKIV